MLNTTLSRLRCPHKKRGKTPCYGGLELSPESESTRRNPGSKVARKDARESSSTEVYEIRSGQLKCKVCSSEYPILAGVAVLVEDVHRYLIDHVKGIAQVVPDSEIPARFRADFLDAKSEIQIEHIEEDLEAERVNALYVMNHYLQAKSGLPKSRASERSTPGQSTSGAQSAVNTQDPWWKPRSGPSSATPESAVPGSAVMDQLIREHWDHGPLTQVTNWVEQEKIQTGISGDVVELGCGVAGLCSRLQPHVRSYLGVDSSFISIAIGRHLALGVPYSGRMMIPEDLLQGPVSREFPKEWGYSRWNTLEGHQALPGAGTSETNLSADNTSSSKANSGADNTSRSKTYSGTTDLIVGEVDSPPLQQGVWDCTISLNMIDMLDDPATLPALQSKLLKPDGIAIQSCPYIWHPGVAKQLRKKIPPKLRDSSSLAVEWLYEQSGFKIKESKPDIPWLFFKHVRQIELYSVHAFIAQIVNKTK